MSTQIPGLYILDSEKKGRGIYTSIDISIGDVIETAPVIICDSVDTKLIHKTSLHDYYFTWAEKECAIALGYGSLYNHSEDPNTEFILDYENMCIDFEAIKEIKAGEEITISYHSDEETDFKIWFDVVE